MPRRGRIYLAAVMVCASPALPLRAQFATADDDFQEGVGYYEAKNYALAMDRFTHALLLDPANREIRRYIVLTQEGITQATADPRPEELQAMLRRAQEVLQRRRKRTEETLAQLKIASTESALQNPASLLEACRGIDIVVDVSLGDDPESVLIKHYVKSICGNLERTMDSHVGIKTNRIQKISGYLAFCRADWAEAVREWTAALNADPQDRQLAKLLDRAKTHLRKENLDAQIDFLARKGEREYASRQLREAAATFDSILVLDPYNQKALALFRELSAKLESQKLEPIPRWMRLASESQARGDAIAAAGYWINVLELDPANDAARLNLAKNKVKLLAEAASSGLDRGPKAGADPSSERGREVKRLYTLGLIQYSEGNLPAARESLKAAQQIDPKDEYVEKALRRVENELEMKR